MTMTKWAIYTVLLGLIPIVGRLIVALLARAPIPLLAAGDLVGFGLVLVITNINGLEHASNVAPDWKTQSVGVSLLIVTVLSTVFVASCLPAEQFDPDMTLLTAAILSGGALAHSYSVWNHLVRRAQA